MPVVILELVLLLMDSHTRSQGMLKYCKYNDDIMVIDELGIPPLWELVHMQMLKWEGLPAQEMVI